MKEILKCLETILSRGYSTYNIFNDWLDLMIFALQEDDEQYLSIVNRYKNDKAQGEREIDLFCNAFALLQIEMKKTNEDVLGELYMQWNMNNKYRGQFFTPKNIASMMAKMLNPQGKVLDPCCGSGVLLVEAIKTMDIETIEKSLICGQDIDITCVKMCALNLLFFNVNGYVIWGDSLLMECRKVYQTKRTGLGGIIRELDGDILEAFKRVYIPTLEKTFTRFPDKSITQEEINSLSKKGEQLSFF